MQIFDFNISNVKIWTTSKVPPYYLRSNSQQNPVYLYPKTYFFINNF